MTVVVYNIGSVLAEELHKSPLSSGEIKYLLGIDWPCKAKLSLRRRRSNGYHQHDLRLSIRPVE